jgi:hypothetical protein
MNDIFVDDPRPDDDSSLEAVPRLRTFSDITAHFAPLEIDQRHGWEATPPGEACWKLVGFHVTVGPMIISPKVLDQSGVYLPNMLVYWHYPGSPTLPDDAQPRYFNHGLSAKTKYEGNGAHFVITADHVVEADGGPDSVWVSAVPGGPQFSDAVHKLGWHGATNHLIVSPILRHTVKGAVEPPDTHDYHLALVVGGEEIGRISISQVEAGETYLAIFGEGSQVGRVPMEQGEISGDCLVLRDGDRYLGHRTITGGEP